MPKTIPRLDPRLAALLRTFGPLIYSRCRRVLTDEALVESAMQEVFLRSSSQLSISDARGSVQVLASACEQVFRERRDS